MAQSDSSALWMKYEKEVIYFSGLRYVKGDGLYPMRGLKSEFEYSPMGKALFQMHRADKRWSKLLYVLGLASEVIWLTSINNPNSNLAKASVVSMGVLFGGSIHFTIRAEKRKHKAVWLRNRDILLRK